MSKIDDDFIDVKPINSNMDNTFKFNKLTEKKIVFDYSEKKNKSKKKIKKSKKLKKNKNVKKKIKEEKEKNFYEKFDYRYKSEKEIANQYSNELDIDLDSKIRISQSSRETNSTFRKNLEAFTFDRFQYLDVNPQKVGNLKTNFTRGGDITRESKNNKTNFKKKDFDFNY